jgi:predicted DNA-binding protein
MAAPATSQPTILSKAWFPIGIALLSVSAYRRRMKTLTVKVPEGTLRRLKDAARATGRPVAALVRERIEAADEPGAESVYALTSDLAGILTGTTRSATNARRKFRKG